jgi:SAM-dependent methyltransferase
MEVAATPAEVQERVADLSAAAWTLAAIAAAVEAGVPDHLLEPADAETLGERTGLEPPLAARLAEAFVAAGLARREGDRFVAAPGLAALWQGGAAELVRADLRTGLLQQAAFVESAIAGRLRTGWSHSDERLLQAQGTASAAAVAFIEERLLPTLGDLGERLDSGEGAFLDVGTGAGAIVIGFCLRHPRLRAVALDPLDAALALARRNVAAAGLDDRVELRADPVQDLEDREAFDLVWLPGMFLPPAVRREALNVVHRAMRPGGWLIDGCLGGGDDSPRAVAARLRAVLWGGDTADPDSIARILEEHGFADVRLLPRLASGLVPIVARRP